MTFLYLISIARKDNSIADIAWGPGFIITAAVVMLMQETFGARNFLLQALVTIWGLRLGIRIFLRNFGHGEDWRYKKWREEWGSLFYLRSFLQVFLLQGAILLVNAAPLVIANTTPGDILTWTDYAGLGIWILGFFFEAVGDYQLDRFIKDPANKGSIMDRGLWRYTRHPNYFGEVTMWWGIFMIGLGAPLGYLGIIGPTMITLMIVFVSGIPMTERAMDHDPAFQAYKKRTSALIPWPPRG
jgi:steroid 5-alpha reductase family enzyme